MCTSGDMSTSGLAAAILDLLLPVRSRHCRYYRWIAGPRKHRFNRGHCVAIMCSSKDNTFDLATAILDLSLPVKSDSIVGITVGLLDPEIIELAVGITLLLCEQLYSFPMKIFGLSTACDE